MDGRLSKAIDQLEEKRPTDHTGQIIKVNGFRSRAKNKGNFSPLQAKFLITLLRKYDIKHHRTWFKISIRKDEEKNQLIRMSDEEITFLYPYLSESQIKWVGKNRRYAA